MPEQPGLNTHPHARLQPNFPSHGCIDDLTTDLQAMWVSDVLGIFFTCYPYVFVQPGTGRRLVDWCRNSISVL